MIVHGGEDGALSGERCLEKENLLASQLRPSPIFQQIYLFSDFDMLVFASSLTKDMSHKAEERYDGSP